MTKVTAVPPIGSTIAMPSSVGSQVPNNASTAFIDAPPPVSVPQEGVKAAFNGHPLARSEDSYIRTRLQSKIATNFVGIKVATFGSCEYDPSFEPLLREMGVDLLIIADPQKQDRDRFGSDAGFFYKPEKIIWRQPARSWDVFLSNFNSTRRNQLRAKLRKSADVTVETAPLTVADFAAWYPLYEREVVGKKKGRRLLDASWAKTKGRYLAKYRKVFLREPQTGELLGGAIISCKKPQGRIEIAYAAYHADHKYRELSIRTLYEAMEYAVQKGYDQISYGMDTNLFGHHLTVGLMEFKASLGFRPFAGRTHHLLKVLNSEKLDEDYFFFSFDGEGGLKAEYFSPMPRSLKIPEGIVMSVHPR